MALDASLEAVRSDDAGELWAIYESRLQDVLASRPGLSRDSLHDAVRRAYLNWRRAQKKPPAIPPRA